MKRNFLALIALLFMLASCKVTQSTVTEDYIRNKIQEHKIGNYSQMKLFPIDLKCKNFKRLDTYAYLYDDKKNVFFFYTGTNNDICESKNYCDYIIIDEKQISEICTKFNDLESKRKSNKYIGGEIYTIEYSISDRLRICLRSESSWGSSSEIEFWFDGAKYILDAKVTIELFDKFLKGLPLKASPSAS
jgi:hypothetical protein